jgi:carbamoyltransferase
MTNKKFHQLFGGPPRIPESEITQREMDLAHSIQKVTEEVIMRCVRHVFRQTGEKSLCLAGGVALNCVANGRILREGPFEDIWIQPAAGDAGGALGAALFTWFEILANRRSEDRSADLQRGSYLGPDFDDEKIERFLKEKGYPYSKLDENALIERTVDELEREKVIGWFQGKMEFGPRALGARSIIGDARSPEMQSRMNLKIKFRESFRPFAPSILEEYLSEYFELDRPSPYMLLVAPVRNQKRNPVPEMEKNRTGLDLLKVKRSEVPAITHVDYSARIQSVGRSHLPIYHQLLKRFFERTNCPVIINTSFNVRGEPIVNTPEDAYTCFMRTEMDYLVLGNFFIDKNEQPEFDEKTDWRRLYEPD